MTTVKDLKWAAAEVRRTKLTLEILEAALRAKRAQDRRPRDYTEPTEVSATVALVAYKAAVAEQFRLEVAYASEQRRPIDLGTELERYAPPDNAKT